MFNFVNKLLNLSMESQNSFLHNTVFLDLPVASVITDKKGVIVDINRTFTDITGYLPSESIGKNMSFLKSDKHSHIFYKNFWTKLNTQKKHSVEIWNTCKNGANKLFHEKIAQITHSNNSYYLITLEDITEKKRLSDRNEYLATHDPLTELANRTLLLDRFSHAVLNAKRTNTKVAFIMCDLNKFKEINDNYGHKVGDQALKRVSDTLTYAVRNCDTVARYGGDEFIIVLENIKLDSEITHFVEQLTSNFPINIMKNNMEVAVHVSIGYSCFPLDGNSFEELLEAADNRMYKNKSSSHLTEITA